jgi:cold shock CspA family protein/ribosome-associated translation inhibitor RaiA
MSDGAAQANLELSFHGMEPSRTIKAKVREHVEKLQKRYNEVTSWHVFIDGPIGSAGVFEVSIEARVPGAELAVGRKPGDRNSHSDALVAIRDSFAAMERQLKKRRRQRSGEVKTHEGKPQGQVARLFHDQGYGFVTVNTGPDVYFHRNAVVEPGFDELKVGDTVELTIAYGESAQGPQATSLRRISPLRYDPQPT